MTHSVYIIHSEKLDRFYIGESIDPEERLKQHNTGYYKDSSTKITNDWKLHFILECKSRTQAIKIEKHIKRMRNKTYYQNILKHPEISQKLLARYSFIPLI